MSLVFEEPPEVQPGVGKGISEKWSAVADSLREVVGKWARVAPVDDEKPFDSAQNASGLANRIRTGQSKAFLPVGHFQTRSGPMDGGYGVWARYVGEDWEPDPIGDYATAHTVAQLREQAKERGLPVSGARREVAKRILEHDAVTAADGS